MVFDIVASGYSTFIQPRKQYAPGSSFWFIAQFLSFSPFIRHITSDIFNATFLYLDI